VHSFPHLEKNKTENSNIKLNSFTRELNYFS